MLTTLSVHNFALFDKLVVDFQKGFNIITGETGAGKSILVDAFDIVLGGKALTEYIRTGTDFYLVQAIFDIKDSPSVCSLLDEQGIDYPDGELILSSRIVLEGKNVSTVNGIRIPASLLKQIGERLVDVHGQYESQLLLKPDSYLHMLDSYAGVEGKELLKNYRSLYNDLKQIDKAIEQNASDAVERERSLDILSWEIEEIEKADLKVGEDKILEEESDKLANAEKITSALAKAYSLLDDEKNEQGGVLTTISDISRELVVASRYDVDLERLSKSFLDIEYVLSDIKAELLNKLESQELEPQSLESVQQRLDIIYKLKKKYGSEIEEILVYCTNAQEKREHLLQVEENSHLLEQQKTEILAKIQVSAKNLTDHRKKIAKTFVGQVVKHIHDLAMDNAEFVVEIKQKENYTQTGLDEVQFLFTANSGQALKPLNKVASGGEISRIALAIKSVLMGKVEIPTMVFDEVDSGVGGSTAQRMAEKLSLIALERQVLCITHLPQVACMADCHIYIEKKQTQKETWIEVSILDDKGRIEELTRMIAGDNKTELAKENAEQMLQLARDKKATLIK